MAALLFGTASHVRAQAAATVAPSSAVYDHLESVSALFPVRGLFLGEKPVSARQIDVVVARLSAALDSAPPSARREWARRELKDAIVPALHPDAGVRRFGRQTLLGAWRADAASSDARTEIIAPNGLGYLDAITHPFEARRDGWPVVQGTSATIAPTGVLAVGDAVAIVAEPRLSFVAPHDLASSADFTVHKAYARGVYHNIALRGGWDEILWGQSAFGALLLSGNARPFPSVTLGTDTAITLPWLLRFVGPVRASIFVADLGRTQNPSHAKLAAWQASIQPWTRFELGVSVLTQTGGSGGPKATFFRRVVDLFPVIDAIAPQHEDLQISNKLAGGNLRLRFPELSGLDLYYELQIDDFDARRLRSSLIDDSGHLLGLRLPLILRNGQVAWRAEWHRTSLRLYEHTQFPSGITYRGRLLGDPIGPHAEGAYVNGTWQRSPLEQYGVLVADERRDPSLYMTLSNDPRDRTFRFERVTDDPLFRRRRVFGFVDRPLTRGAVRLGVGYDRAWRSGFEPRSEWFVELGLRSHASFAF